MPLQITSAQLEQMVDHARREAPLECCGLIGGDGDRAGKIYPARNELASPVRYRIAPEDMYRAWREIEVDRDGEIIAFYHSHPASEAYPSATDLREAVETGYSAVSRFLIVSLADPRRPVARLFWLKGGTVDEDVLAVVDSAPGVQPNAG